MMKSRIVILLCSFVLLCLLFIVNPGTGPSYDLSMEYANNRVKNSSIYFSHRPGFYDQAFELSISAPTNDIYYTLDGSEPTRESLKYTEPLLITDVTSRENVHASRIDTSAGFLAEEIALYSPNVNTHYATPFIAVPDFPVDKCTIIRAVYYDENGNKSDVQTGSYFVDYQNKIGYDDIGIVSIVTDSDNLFDHENGIYVLGKVFENYVAQDGFVTESGGFAWNLWNANYRQRGKEWEREAAVQFFDGNKNLALSQEAGIRIQGGGSRGFVVKSLNLFAREEYDGNSKLYCDFWGTGYNPEAATLTSGGGDFSLVLDRLSSDLAEGLSFSSRHFKPHALFLNGEYWGVYYLTEKYDKAYLNYYYQVPKDNVAIIKGGALEEGDPEDKETFYKDFALISNLDMADERNYDYACKLLDMESTIDYMAYEIYVARSVDWLANFENTQLWKTKEVGSGPYGDGCWRWLCHDQNSANSTANLLELNSIAEARSISPFFDSLCSNPEFQYALVDRIIQFGCGRCSADNVNQLLDGYYKQMEKPAEKHFLRFWSSDITYFKNTINSIRTFYDNRFEVVVGFLKSEFPNINIDEIVEKYRA